MHAGRLLYISYDFAPLGSSGCRRAAQTVHELERLGWHVTVLSARWDEGAHLAWDPSLLESIPSTVRMLRPWNPDNWRKHSRAPALRAVRTGERGGRGLSGFKRAFRSLWIALNMPDPAQSWRPLALWAGLREIRTCRPDVILATSPAQSNLLVGRTLGRLTRVPLVTEFRDAWTVEPVRNRLKAVDYWPRRAIERAMERSVVRRSQRVISMTEGLTSDFRWRYPELPAERFVTIPNGFVQAEFDAASARASIMAGPEGVFRIVYTGKLSDARSPRPFLKALSLYLSRHPKQRSRVCFDIVGVCYPFDDGSTVEDQIAEYDLSDVVQLQGFVSRGESLAWQASADLLLLVVGVVPAESAWVYGLAAKAFDYSLAGPPVLCVSAEGPTASYVRESGIGEVRGHDDIEGMASTLERAVAEKLNCQRNEDYIAAYEFGRLMKRLSALLSNAVRPSSQKDGV